MGLRVLTLFALSTSFILGQGLPDRDKLVEKFIDEETTHEAAAELIKYFQWGGVRSIIRNLDKLPYDLAASYGQSLRHIELLRFRNDLNANLTEAEGQYSKALYLMLLATIGRELHQSVFDPYLAESEPVRVRLAAASGIVKIQNPALYDRFHQIADDAVIDPISGQDDFYFADISKENLGFYLYTKSKLGDDPSDGIILSAIVMSENDSVDVYEKILDLRKRKFIPVMIDHAIRVGGVQLLEVMADHRRARRYRDEISQALPSAQAIAEYRNKLIDTRPESVIPLGPLIPPIGNLGSGSEANPSGPRTYAVVQVSANGVMKVVTSESLQGVEAKAALRALNGKTLPSHENWEAVESYVLVVYP